MGYSGAGGKLIHEKNQKSKILWHCPFKVCPLPSLHPASTGDLKEAGTGIRPFVGKGLHPIREMIIWIML